MKIEKWNEKTGVYLEKLIQDEKSKNVVHYCNVNDGVYFCDSSGHWARFLPDQNILITKNNCNKIKDTPFLENVFQENIKSAVLASSVETGTTGKAKCRKLTKDNVSVYVYETLLRAFPKNARFYISGPTNPVIVGLWESSKLYVIGLVMPFRIESTSGFVAC